MNAADELTAALADAQAATAGTSGALVPLGGASPEVVKTSYAVARAEATRALQRLQAAAKTREEELRRELDRQISAVQKIMDPLKAEMQRLTEGLWTVSLYLGRDEEIERLAEGAPAPAGTPIVLRQLVLAMDEECLVAAEEGGIDASRVGDFGAWLMADPAHLAQVLPDAKGVVVLVPSRQRRSYGNAFADQAMDDANKRSYWLIRNGDNVYLMTTDIKVGDRLLPARSEFEEFFYTSRYDWDTHQNQRVPLEPGSDAWLKAEQASDAQRRHYMRIMLILQGLADRTTVFHPLPEGGVQFMRLASQDEGKVRIINEIDNVLTTGREDFRIWQRRLNMQLRPGMRIIGAFNGDDFRAESSEYDSRRGGNSRLHPAGASYPDSYAIHIIEERRGNDLVFRYQRTDTIDDTDQWGGYRGQRVPKVRASCTLHPGDSFILPVDLVTAEELETYLHARTERHAYISMVPLIKAALGAKRAEVQAEEPFRLLLAGRLAQAYDLDPGEVLTQDVPDLVDWWKLANRWHRPLVSEPATEAKAITAVVREYGARLRAARINAEDDPTMVAEIIRRVSRVMCVARRRDGLYVGYEPAAPGERVYLTEHRFTRAGNALEPREWIQVPGRTLAALTVLWTDNPTWAEWKHGASRSDYLTGPERDGILASLLERARRDGDPIAVTYKQRGGGWDDGKTFEVYAWAHDPRAAARGPDDPGRGMVQLVASWRRGPDGDPQLNVRGPRYSPMWAHYTHRGHGTPWRDENSEYLSDTCERLIWSDRAQLARVDEAWKDIDARTAVVKARNDKIWAAERTVRVAWDAADLARERARFLEDYAGAEDLWEGHLKALRRRKYPEWRGLRPMLERLVYADVDLAGLTVAEAAKLDPDKPDQVVPDELAGLPLTEPDEDGTDG